MGEDDGDPFKDFWRARTAIEGPCAARFHEQHDAYDLAAIAALGGDRDAVRMLDLGCGTCVIGNLVVDRLGWTVHAVDYVPEFLTHALDDPRLTTELGDVRSYSGPDGAYDVITLLGVLMYLDGGDAERAAIYERCAAMLAPGGALLVKAQFGVRETVRVDTYSEALATDYRAIYWSLEAEVELLRAAFGPDAVTVTDPYPPELNRYENTHTHHLIARV
jgi:trans-aconitate methyltransferase